MMKFKFDNEFVICDPQKFLDTNFYLNWSIFKEHQAAILIFENLATYS